MPVDPRAGVRSHTRSQHQKRVACEHPAHRNGVARECPAHAREPDVRRFENLFRTYRAGLCAFARGYVRCPAAAEDLVQDVFLRMWERRSSLPGRVNPKRYLFTAVRNQALKHLAHQSVVRRSHQMVKQAGRVPGTGEEPLVADQEMDARELAVAIRAAVDRLPARCREAYVRYREHGISYAEIAEVMGISVRTVETQLARANRVLRRELAEWVE